MDRSISLRGNNDKVITSPSDVKGNKIPRTNKIRIGSTSDLVSGIDSRNRSALTDASKNIAAKLLVDTDGLVPPCSDKTLLNSCKRFQMVEIWRLVCAKNGERPPGRPVNTGADLDGDLR